jgi:hypothetical protein
MYVTFLMKFKRTVTVEKTAELLKALSQIDLRGMLGGLEGSCGALCVCVSSCGSYFEGVTCGQQSQ